jgi:hypothetical protein
MLPMRYGSEPAFIGILLINGNYQKKTQRLSYLIIKMITFNFQ